MAALGWMQNLDNAASEVGSPLGPGAGRELMLLYIGRLVLMAWGLDMLVALW